MRPSISGRSTEQPACLAHPVRRLHEDPPHAGTPGCGDRRDGAARPHVIGCALVLAVPQLGRAIAAVHRDPGHPWSLTALASLSMMSRSAFAARFAAVAGTPPMTYVAEYRL